MNFPGTEQEPARCGPGVAQHIQVVYKEYLAAFDTMYIGSMVNRQRGVIKPPESGMNPQGPGAGPSGAPGMANNMPMQNGQQMSNVMPSNPNFPPQMSGLNENSLAGISQLVGVSDPQQIQQLLKWSMLNQEQLRQQGVPLQLIEKVELHRAILQRTYQGQLHFREQLQKNHLANNQLANGQVAAAEVLRRQRILNNAHIQAQQQPQHKVGMPGAPGVMHSGMPSGMPQPNQMQQPPQQQQQQQPPQPNQAGPSMVQGPNGQIAMRRTRPSPEEIQKAVQFVTMVKAEYSQSTFATRLDLR